MTRYYYLRPGRQALPLIHTRETIQIKDKLKTLKPGGESMISPGFVSLGRGIKGCLVCRLNRESLAALILLAWGSLSETKPLAQSQGLFVHTLTVNPLENEAFTLVREEQGDLILMKELSLIGFSLSARRMEALFLKLEVEGRDSENWTFGKEGAPSPHSGGFLFLKGDEIEIDGNTLPDLAAFSISGSYREEIKTHELMIRRKDSQAADYGFMRKDISVSMILRSRDLYEEGQPVRCEITIPTARYLGEESFPDNKGIWGREFRYALNGSFQARVFTSLYDRGKLI